MLITWNDKTTQWFEAASEYTGFHRKLTDHFLPHLQKRNSLLDLGCGAGMIDITLAPSFGSITCVDRSAEALSFLARIARKRLADNIETVLSDAEDVEGRWDNVLMVFFGPLEGKLPRFLALCEEALVAVVHADANGNLGPKAYQAGKCNTVARTIETLNALGARYTLIEDAIEYGQPFASRAEAAEFVRAYSKNPPEMAVEAYLDETLVKLEEGSYPLYLPNRKGLGIFIIRRDENANLCGGDSRRNPSM